MLAGHLLHARIFAIDTDACGLPIEWTLRKRGFINVVTSKYSEARNRILRWRPDAILIMLQSECDLALEALKFCREIVDAPRRPTVVVVTGPQAAAKNRQFLKAGADDVVSIPVQISELTTRLQHLLDIRLTHLSLLENTVDLTTKVQKATLELTVSRWEAFHRLSLAAELRDDDTGEHIHRVGTLSAAIGRVLGVDEELVPMLRAAAALHDIGKIGIPDAILLKPGPLNEREHQIMRTHTLIGGKILGNSQSPVIRLAEQIAVSHHENWNGTGYPRRLAGKDIPWPARIVAVADVYDALTHKRTYKPAWTSDEAEKEIARLAGTKFDPNVVNAFLALTAAKKKKSARSFEESTSPARSAPSYQSMNLASTK